MTTEGCFFCRPVWVGVCNAPHLLLGTTVRKAEDDTSIFSAGNCVKLEDFRLCWGSIRARGFAGQFVETINGQSDIVGGIGLQVGKGDLAIRGYLGLGYSLCETAVLRNQNGLNSWDYMEMV